MTLVKTARCLHTYISDTCLSYLKVVVKGICKMRKRLLILAKGSLIGRDRSKTLVWV